jgi:ubiquinone/menaquinone biosynthesis C-methylase UbiE
VGKRRDKIIAKLVETGVMTPCQRIVEIGAGTGMYLEKFIELCKPEKFEVYETNPGWGRYLKETYSTLILHDADGRTLSHSSDNSADLVTAHAVFVYLPIVRAFEYLVEAVRVCRSGGFLIFDCFTSSTFTLEEILSFRTKSGGYDFPVVIDAARITEFCARYSLKLIASFETTYHSSKSTYFVIQKCGSPEPGAA